VPVADFCLLNVSQRYNNGQKQLSILCGAITRQNYFLWRGVLSVKNGITKKPSFSGVTILRQISNTALE
jgi:hypothetical protein